MDFDPVPLLVEELEQRFAPLAVFCADYVGGGAAVGVKWRAAAFAPGPLQPERAYMLRPLGPAAVEGEGRAAKRAKRSGAAAEAAGEHPAVVGQCVPDVQAVLADIMALGAGLVESVEVLHGPLA